MSARPAVRRTLAALTLVVVALTSYRIGVANGQGKDSRVYELRTYTTNPGRLSALHKRFAEHTLAIFERHGMHNVMYWTPTDSALKDNTLIYVISHASREQADANWKAFGEDPEWIKVRDASEVDGKILAKPPERVYMTMTPYSPAAPKR